MLKTLVLLALVTISLLGIGCERQSRTASSSNVRITLTAIPYPVTVGNSRLVIQISDLAGKPIDDAVLSIKGDMTHAGMVPLLAEKAGVDGDGYYNVPFEWTMAGDWVVTIEAVFSDGTRAKQHFDLTVLTEDDALCTHDDQQGKPLPANSQD